MKQSFLPTEDYCLKQGRKVLDVTLSWRFSGLPNNAKLELVKSESSRAEQDVVIALQLETGERLQGTFPPGTTLWDLLLHWENQENSPHKGLLTKTDSTQIPSIQPVCIYMRDEIIGEMALQETNLRKLGLTGGKAVIRLAHRPVEDSVMAEIINSIEKERAKNTRLNELVARQLSNSSDTQPSIAETQQTDTDQAVKSETCNLTTEQAKKSATESQSQSTSEPMDVESSSQSQTKQSESNKSVPMEVESDSSVKMSSLDSKNSGASKTNTEKDMDQSSTHRSPRQLSEQERQAESIRQMNIPGVEVFTPQDFDNLSPEQQRAARQLATSYMFSVGLTEGLQQMLAHTNKGTKPKKMKSSAENTAPFKDFKFPEETKGQDLYRNELSQVEKEEFKPCERETVVYSLEENLGRSSSVNEDLPDEFFEVNEGDVRKMMVDLQRRAEQMYDQPLLPKAMRELQMEEKYSKYERVVVRIQFPDKLVLQGMFRPRETVFALEKYVKGYLGNKELPFYLYTAPPKCVLKDKTKTLIQAELVPATVVYFGVQDEESKLEHYLSEEVRKDIKSRTEADKIFEKWFHSEEEPVHKPSKSNHDMTSTGATGSTTRSTRPRSNQDTASTSSSKEPGVPKWLKLGKK